MPLSYHGEGFARFYAYLVIILVGVLGILMVSTLRYSSLKTVGTGRRNLYLVLVVAAIGMLMWLYSQYVLLILSVGYVSHGVIWYLLSTLRPRRTPDADEPIAEFSSQKR